MLRSESTSAQAALATATRICRKPIFVTDFVSTSVNLNIFMNA